MKGHDQNANKQWEKNKTITFQGQNNIHVLKVETPSPRNDITMENKPSTYLTSEILMNICSNISRCGVGVSSISICKLSNYTLISSTTSTLNKKTTLNKKGISLMRVRYVLKIQKMIMI